MKINKLNEQYLEKGKPYMLRNDGELFECGKIHPYLFYAKNKPIEYNMSFLVSNWYIFEWFYNHTQYADVKNDLKLLWSEYYRKGFNVPKTKIIREMSDFDFEQLYWKLQNDLDQEFCRVRTSNMLFGGTNGDVYFRISSVGFNWFNLIWQLVYDNRNFVETVTISSDSKSRGNKIFYYNHGNTIIDHLPVDEFINLTGNPVFENVDDIDNKLLNGHSLEESFGKTHPFHINAKVGIYWDSQDKNI